MDIEGGYFDQFFGLAIEKLSDFGIIMPEGTGREQTTGKRAASVGVRVKTPEGEKKGPEPYDPSVEADPEPLRIGERKLDPISDDDVDIIEPRPTSSDVQGVIGDTGDTSESKRGSKQDAIKSRHVKKQKLSTMSRVINTVCNFLGNVATKQFRNELYETLTTSKGWGKIMSASWKQFTGIIQGIITMLLNLFNPKKWKSLSRVTIPKPSKQFVKNMFEEAKHLAKAAWWLSKINPAHLDNFTNQCKGSPKPTRLRGIANLIRKGEQDNAFKKKIDKFLDDAITRHVRGDEKMVNVYCGKNK